MDLALLDVTQAAEHGAWLTLKHPSTGDPLPIRIKLAGRDSEVWRAGERQFADQRLAQMAKTGKMGTITTAQAEARGLKLLASVTLDWEGVELDGKPVPCTKEQAAQLYERFPWMREQVDEFVGERANFLPAPADGQTPVEALIEERKAATVTAEELATSAAKN